jgi:8-oxo-dGTP diphosphatase
MKQLHCVGALIVHRRSILLGKRSSSRTFYPNVWDVFGGHVEAGEQPEQTLVRELREELNITPTQWRHLETLVMRSVQEREEEIHCQLYLVSEWIGTPVNQQPDEHVMIQWFSIEQAVHLPLADPSYPKIFARLQVVQ